MYLARVQTVCTRQGKIPLMARESTALEAGAELLCKLPGDGLRRWRPSSAALRNRNPIARPLESCPFLVLAI